MKIRPVAAQLFDVKRTDVQTDRHEEAKSCYS